MSLLNNLLDFFQYIWDQVKNRLEVFLDELSEIISDCYWFIVEKIARGFGMMVIHVSSFFLNETTAHEHGLGARLRSGVGLALSSILWLVVQIFISCFGLLSSLFGLRRGKNYSFSENFLAWFPLLLLGVTLPFLRIVGDFGLSQMALFFSFSIIVLGLNILVMNAGQSSLGHAAFVLIGSYIVVYFYTTGIMGHKIPLVFSIIFGALLTGVLGALLGFPAVRVKGPYLALLTLGVMLVVRPISKASFMEPYTHGTDGFSFESPSPPVFLHFLTERQYYYYLTLGFFVASYVFAHILLNRSKIGRAFIAVRDSEEKSDVLGINVRLYKLLAFGVSAFLGALGGSLQILGTGFIGPDSQSLRNSLEYLVASGLGGSSLLGSVVGGGFLAFQIFIVSFLNRFFSNADKLLWAFYGMIVIIVLIFAPRGIAGSLSHRLYESFFSMPKRRQHRRDPPPDFDLDEEMVAVMGGRKKDTQILEPSP